jgi:uncharacterized pyridoxamine 5'-phosphate oxidase family protein
MILSRILKDREYINVATADASGRPNAAPKFILKYEKPFIYLVDFITATTVANLRQNPRVSLAFMDLDNLEGYRLNGSVEIVEEGADYERLAEEVRQKLMRLSVDRIIEAGRTGKKDSHFEIEFPDRFLVYRITIEDVSRIGAGGDLYREGIETVL